MFIYRVTYSKVQYGKCFWNFSYFTTYFRSLFASKVIFQYCMRQGAVTYSLLNAF